MPRTILLVAAALISCAVAYSEGRSSAASETARGRFESYAEYLSGGGVGPCGAVDGRAVCLDVRER